MSVAEKTKRWQQRRRRTSTNPKFIQHEFDIFDALILLGEVSSNQICNCAFAHEAFRQGVGTTEALGNGCIGSTT